MFDTLVMYYSNIDQKSRLPSIDVELRMEWLLGEDDDVLINIL